MKADAHDLANLFTWLRFARLDWRGVTVASVGEWVAWLRLPVTARQGRLMVLPMVEPAVSERTLQRKLAAVSAFYGFHRGLDPKISALIPTLILGPQSRGALLGALVAIHLGVGLVEARKNPGPAAGSDRWLTARTPPDYKTATSNSGYVATFFPPPLTCHFVDDWADTGGQTVAARSLVDQAGATWCGATVIVDALHDSRLRRDLNLKSIVQIKDL